MRLLFSIHSMSSVIILIIILLTGIPALSQHTDSMDHSEQARSLWIQKSVGDFKGVQMDTCTTIIQPQIIEIEDYYRISYRFTSPGCIRFDNGDSVFITFNSSHDDPDTGDIALAVDNRSRVFVNYGHVCGGIIHFILEQKIEIQSVDNFFRHTVSDTDSMPWMILKH